MDDELTDEQLEFAQMLTVSVRKNAERRAHEEARFRRRMEIVIRCGCVGLGMLLGAAIAGRAQW